MKDLFSAQSLQYARFRPDYPSSLFDYILSYVPLKKTAWDAGTGNGQCAAVLARYFEQVIATDISDKQISEAAQAPNIDYFIQPAEHTHIETGSVQLVTIAQALHWFHFDAFYQEVKRVAAPGAIIAAWCYSLLRINETIDPLLDSFHYSTMANYWEKERTLVDNGYQNIPFPFKKMADPGFRIEKEWTPDDLAGYLGTWSAVQKFMTVNGYSPVPAFMGSIAPHWPKKERRKIIFPIHLLLGTIN